MNIIDKLCSRKTAEKGAKIDITHFDFEDFDDSNISGMTMEMDIDELIDSAKKEVTSEIDKDSRIPLMDKANVKREARIAIKRLWIEKINRWASQI